MVKKLTAIFLLFVFLFSLIGYQYLIVILSAKADQRMEAAIDNYEYSDAELIEIRVPLNMPYQERYTDFERHYGTITIDGKVHNYVKRKIEGAILVLKCIANEARQQLKNTADELVKSNSGQDQENNNGKKQSFSFAKIFAGDYDDRNQFPFFSPDYTFIDKLHTAYAAMLNDVLIRTPHQPPKA